MTAALVCIPLFSAFTGWLIVRLSLYFIFHPVKPYKIGNITLQGVYYKNEKAFKSSIIRLIKEEMPPVDRLSEQLTSAENLNKLRPEIEAHIDSFLKVKLKEAIPMIGMLIGERTINQLKGLFMQEMETLFPSIMKSYITHLAADRALDDFLQERLALLTPGKVKSLVDSNTAELAAKWQWMGALAGFVLGLIQLILIIFLLQ